jgi:hypothetical protein
LTARHFELLPYVFALAFLAFIPPVSADPPSISPKATAKKADAKESSQVKPSVFDKTSQCLQGFKFNCEQQASDNAIVLSLRIPGDVGTAWQQLVQTCHSSAVCVGKNATAFGRWLDGGGKNLNQVGSTSSFVSPIVSSATKYCSKVRTVAAGDGRAKTIAER